MASKKWRWLVALLILGTSLVLPLKGSVLAHQVAWPFVEPQVRAKVAGDVITYTIWLKNTTHAVQQNVEIRFKIPHGTTFVESGAGDLGVNRGAFDGKEVGWIQGSLAGGVRQGPFLVVVKTNPWNSEHPHETVAARAWVRWQLGSFLSKALVMQNPLMPPSMTISDEEEKRGLVHIEYFGTWRNLNDLRDQVANWAAGQDSGRRIALEKVERLEAVIQHVPWPTAKLDQFAAEIHEGLHPVEDGLTAQDVAATQAALQKVNEAFHGL
ncbi:MAG: hypothetical protein HY664_04315, partial [Chloroflexi bacterium]|nr:hypothetical protein [Chloroflexota bacterium]